MTKATAPTRLLMVEDESGIAVVLRAALIKSGYHVDVAKTGSSGLRKAAAQDYDMFLLDLGLPDMSGLSICRQLRTDGIESPIIILTAEDTVRTKVSLFDAGANDYVTKPFSVDELEARIRACLRALTKPENKQTQTVGELTLNPLTRSVQRGSIMINLTRKEFMILEYLMMHPDEVVTRASILRYVWNGSEAWTNTIDVHIKHLRDKVDRPFSHQLIETVHGVGYKLKVPSVVAKM